VSRRRSSRFSSALRLLGMTSSKLNPVRPSCLFLSGFLFGSFVVVVGAGVGFGVVVVGVLLPSATPD